MKVLYVEDEPVNIAVMQALFSLVPDLELTVAVNGEAGYRAATQDPPDLLLLDLRLPDCHGKQLLERMRCNPSLLNVPAAAVTADHEPDLSDSTFMELWPKPLNVPHILNRLDHLHKEHMHATAAAL